MAINITVPDIAKIKETLRKELAKLETNEYVTVGIHEDTGQHSDSDLTNALLGAILHFGNDSIPPRPWLDVGVQTGNEEYINIIENNKLENPDEILNLIGVTAVGKAKEYMTDLRVPPNAPSTIKTKGSNNPLIDTGALRASIDYKITSTKPEEGL